MPEIKILGFRNIFNQQSHKCFKSTTLKLKVNNRINHTLILIAKVLVQSGVSLQDQKSAHNNYLVVLVIEVGLDKCLNPKTHQKRLSQWQQNIKISNLEIKN